MSGAIVLLMICVDSAEAEPTVVEVHPFIMACRGKPRWLRVAASRAVARLGPGVLPILAQGLAEDDDADASRGRVDGFASGSVHSLVAMGPGAERALPALVAALDRGNATLTDCVAQVLRNIGKPAGAVVPRLARIAREQPVEDGAIWWPVLEALGEIGGPGADALIGLLQDTQGGKERRSIATRELRRCGPTPAIMAALTEAIGDEEYVVRLMAVDTLAALGPAAAPAVGPLEGMLERGDVQEKLGAAVALLRIVGPGHRAALARLREGLSHRCPVEPDDHDCVDVRWAAADFTARIGEPVADHVVPPLLRLLWDETPIVRKNAIEALASFPSHGPAITAALGDVMRAPEDPLVLTKWRKVEAARSFLAVGGDPKAVLPTLVEAMRQNIGREDASTLLGEIALATPEVVNALADAIWTEWDSDIAISRAASTALGRLGPAAAAAVPSLVRVVTLKVSDRNLRHFHRLPAAEALGRIGPAALPELSKLIKSKRPDVRFYAAFALWRAAADGHTDALPLLAHLTHDPDPLVKEYVALALDHLASAEAEGK